MEKRPPLDSSRGGPNQVIRCSVEKRRIKEKNDEVGMLFQKKRKKKICKEGYKEKKK